MIIEIPEEEALSAVLPEPAGGPAISPKLSRDKLEKLGVYLAELIEQGGPPESLETKWNKNWDQYNAVPEPFIVHYVEGAHDVGLHFTKSRVDALNENIISQIFGVTPVISATLQDDPSRKQAESHERAIAYVFEQGRYEEELKALGPVIGCTNHGILKLVKHDEEGLPWPKRIPTGDFVIVGAEHFNIEDALLVGNRVFYIRRDYLRDVARGYYAKHDQQPDAYDEEVTVLAGVESNNDAKRPNDEVIALYEVYFRSDLESFDAEKVKPTSQSKWYKAVVDPERRVVCRLEEYPLSRPPYYSFGFEPNPDRGFWSLNTLAGNLSGCHTVYNALHNLAVYGALMTAFPPMAHQGPIEPSPDKLQLTRPGGQIGTVGMTPPQAVAVQFDMMAVQSQIALIERAGDAAARINQVGIGQQFSKQMTATEASTLAASQAQGFGGYAGTWGYALVDMAYGVVEMLLNDPDSWAHHAPAMGVDLAELEAPCVYSVTGRNPNVQPASVVAALSQVMGMVPPPPPGGMHLLNVGEMVKEMLNQLGIKDAERFLNEPEPAPVDPNLELEGMGVDPSALAQEGGAPGLPPGGFPVL